MAQIDIDRNLLFGVIALQDDLIDPDKFAEVCLIWSLKPEKPLADLLIKRGWITVDDRRAIESKCERKIRKHKGDVRASLGEVAGAEVRDAIRAVDNPEIRQSLINLPPCESHVRIETLVPPHTEQGSRYTLTRVHAEGGLGKVWLAMDGDLNREVALKEIKSLQSDNRANWPRFLKEAQITGQLEHPNIVPVYELSRRKEDDQPYYVMRFVRGGTLRRAIVEFHGATGKGFSDQLELRRLLGAFINVSQAVGYAHSRGVVHRDLKPENIVLGDFGEVIVLDWGLAELVDMPEELGDDHPPKSVVLGEDAQTGKTQGLVGTPHYMAPEQVEGRHDLIDARTDIYALGGILFEILTGHPPAEGTQAEIFEKITTGKIPHARELKPNVPKSLDAIAAKAMEHKRSNRYARALDVAEDVRRWLADEAVSVALDTLSQRLARWSRRNRTWVQAGAVALLLIAGVSTTAALLIQRSARQEKLARLSADARFKDVRELAHKFIFDFHDKIEPLAGATPVRQFVVKTGLEYSDKLFKETGDDPELLHDLAVAYGTSGDIQGGPTASNLNDSVGAMESYRKSLKVAERSVRLHPENLVAHRDLLIAHNKIAGLQEAMGRTADSRMSYQQSNAILDNLERSYPKEDWRRDRAVSEGRTARTLADLGRASDALARFRRAVELYDAFARDQPGDTQRWRDFVVSVQNLGEIQGLLGQTVEALASYSRARVELERLSRDHPDDALLKRDLLVATNSLGETQANLGQTSKAIESFQAGLKMAKALVASDPTNAQAQRDLAISYERVGGSFVMTNRTNEALENFRAGLAIRQDLTTKNPSSVLEQRELSVAQEKCGDMMLRLGKPDDARMYYTDCLSVRRKIADADSISVPARRDLGTAYKKMGTVFSDSNQVEQALASHEEALRIRRDVAKADAKNNSDRRAVVLSLQDVGDAKLRMGNTAAALANYEEALRIAQSIADADPRNTNAQQDLGVSLDRYGKAMDRLGRYDEALASYRKCLKIREALVALDPRNSEDKRELSIVYEHLGRLLNRMKKPDEALEYERKRLTLAIELGEIDPTDTRARVDLSTAYEALGDSLGKTGKSDESMANYLECLKIREALGRSNPNRPLYQKGLAVIYERLGDIAARAGRDVEAIGYYDKILAIRKSLFDQAPKDARARYDLAIAYHGRGYVEAKIGEDERRPREERLAHYIESRKWHQRAIDELTEMERLGTITPADSSIIEELKKLVIDCDVQIQDLGKPQSKKP